MNKNSIDLSTCDREPIHLLGRLQSHGYLLSFDQSDLRVNFLSENVPELFAKSKSQIINNRFKDLLGSKLSNELKRFNHSGKYYQLCSNTFELNDSSYSVYFSRSATQIHVELELNEAQAVQQEHDRAGLNMITDAQLSFSACDKVSELASSAVSIFYEYCGFDRVMIYRFDEQKNGKVIAESKSAGLEPFHGLCYPATDIPKQAWKLYLSQKVRSIADVHDEGIPITANNGNSSVGTLDLSYSVFRSVSPVHIQYLKNMGVRATHAMSIIVDGDMWGMVICHHYKESKHLSIKQRMFSQLFAELLAARLVNIRLLEQNNQKTLFTRIEQAFDQSNQALWPTLVSAVQILYELFKCDAIALIQGDQIQSVDIEANSTYFSALNYWLSNKEFAVFSTCSLKKDGFESPISTDFAGLLCLSLSSAKNEYLCFFRKEKKEKINWAGNPNKPMLVNHDDPNQLSPRNSFAKWVELVDSESEKWTDTELHYAKQLLNRMIHFEVTFHKLEDKETMVDRIRFLLERKSLMLESTNKELEEQLTDKVIEQQFLLQTKEALKQINNSKSQFLANLSHEMRTPLNGLLGLALLIKENTEASDLHELAEMQIHSIDRLLKTVNRILEMARMESESVEADFEHIELKAFFNECLESLFILAKKKKQDLRLIFHQEDDTIVSDRFMLTQIVANLVSNSIKYTQIGGYIEVNVKIINKRDKKILIISVEDNGVGIDEAAQGKIFESFYTEDEESRKKDESSGLGLFLVKKYVDYLKGRILLQSKKGEGSVFTVELEVVRELQ